MQKLLRGWKSFILRFGDFLCPHNFSSKKKKKNKKKNRFEIVLISSIYYTTDVYPYQPAYWEFFCIHLFLFAIICENLFFICGFLSLYENKQAYKYHHLEQIFYHQNTIMIFCWYFIIYVPNLCFLLWILLILCLSTFLLNKVASNSLNSVAIFTLLQY